ncbi:prolyl oligopeptidase family serine peptidase [Niabella insulamsoli]|uniref:S9 family peptidase n=1 Tax=Niabella insulamsoli TaxID=3144874 RepID=UPI0031FC54D8
MRKSTIFIALFFWIFPQILSAQQTNASEKKVLDHSVYDDWQSISKINMSKNGQWVVYNINVQEGNDDLIIQKTDGSYKKTVARGYDAAITGDDRSVIFKIKPLFKEIRQAKIKKKKPDEMPEDSLAILSLRDDKMQKFGRVLSYKTPKERNEWVAILQKNEQKPKPAYMRDKSKDSLKQVIDSLQYVIKELKPDRTNDKDSITDPGRNNRLQLINTATGNSRTFLNVNDYTFNKTGSHLLIEQTLDLRDSAKTTCILLYHITAQKTDTLLRGGNDFKNLALADDGSQAAFLAMRNAKPKDVKQNFQLWHYKKGMDAAIMLVDTLTAQFPKGSQLSEFGKISFNKSGTRLLFATAPTPLPKDTSLVDIDKVNVDIWNYKDDYLQPYQLENRKRDREKSYLAVYDFAHKKMVQVGNPDLPNVYEGKLADAASFVAVTDTGRRIAAQWTGSTLKDIYKIDISNGRSTAAVLNLNGDIRPSWISPSGKYIVWYSNATRHYHAFDGRQTINLTAAINTSLYDEENDVPDDPGPYGVMGWQDGDKRMLIYDRYDIWAIDPTNPKTAKNLTNGRNQQLTYRYLQTDEDEDYIKSADPILLNVFNNKDKTNGVAVLHNNRMERPLLPLQPFNVGPISKAKNADVFAYTKESYTNPPDLYALRQQKEYQLSQINPQQKLYNWGNAALYHWTTFSGKKATGIIYKPENFDSSKQYPVILYFYEKLSDNLYKYIPPSPTPSRLNISFFVSRGYVVMAPDIAYTIGHPAQSAYDYIVSGAQALAVKKWVNKNKMGIQGQSWGGIQVAQLITMTDMFAAAWAGAPVANMTSAYGGIRWGSGLNRQFQYEKTQSRIGATLWEKPDLYIENSPLFHLPKVNTPLVIMANDNDGAVPWYQGIELFTGLRRLGKPVWMLNYNGEEHNLVQRKNKKDIQVREQQYFDWLLKDAPPAKWLTEGVPAINKGNDWGLELAN